MPAQANIPDPVGFPTVLEAELDQIQERRSQVFPKIPPTTEGTGAELENERAHRMRPLGMGISGGGIRSATFNLGILQGLSERGLLPHIDYLSTVSGGGYIGSWLHGVIQRKHAGRPEDAASRLSPKDNPVPGEAGRDPVSWLRKYSNYLAPELGLFSKDFWVIGMIWLRNMGLNQLILVPFLASVLLLAILAGILQQHASRYGPVKIFDLVLAVILLAVTVWTAGKNVRFTALREMGSAIMEPPRWTPPICTISLLLGSFLLACLHSLLYSGPRRFWALVAFLFVLFCGFQWLAGFAECYRRRRPKATTIQNAMLPFHFLWIPLVCASVTAGLLGALSWLFGIWDPDAAPGVTTLAGPGTWYLMAFGGPLIVQAWIIGVSLHIGLMGSDMPDGAREWIARIGAQLEIACAGWMAWFVLAVFGPYWISLLILTYYKTALTAIGAWILTTIGGIFAGKSGKTDGKTADGPPGKTTLEYVGMIAPPVFLVGFLLLISFGVHQAIAGLAHWQSLDITSQTWVEAPQCPLNTCPPASDASWVIGLRGIEEQYWSVLDHKAWSRKFDSESSPWQPACSLLLFGLYAGLLLWAVVLSMRVNINEFSLHHFYKNRLVRCYLGASLGDDRHPNPLTGFDPQDDMPISKLRAIPREPTDPKKEKDKPYYGPYAIVNATLNLNRGSELAKQERKGSAFVFTPLYCGFDPPHSKQDIEEYTRPNAVLKKEGYRSTLGYTYPAGPAMGTAMGISGAAANPNSGYTTSTPLAFLMTIFDVRLGWWLGNTRMDGPSKRPGPMFALKYLLLELFAQTDGRTKYLNLSDGGHLENLGLYELVRRRCRYIIIGDGEQDGELNFGSLGGAIRKCRADFGVEIDIDPQRIRKVKGFSLTHCVVGKITYPEQDDPKSTGGAQGLLLYLKSSLTGDEPEDVIQYYSSNPDFPHQSTANQFFTESQFESYRQLGLHVVRTVFENVHGSLDGDSPNQIGDLFADLERKWYAPSSVAEGVATAHADAYTAIMKRVSDDKALGFLDTRLFDKYSDQDAPPLLGDPDVLRKASYICLDLIQLMENVYTDLHFRNRTDRCNPSNGGWIQVFRYWTRQDIFKQTWAFARYTYNPLFREFYDDLAKEKDPCA